jgi:hypothetical protein
MWQPIKVMAVKETNKGTILQVATTASKEEILKYANGKSILGELKLDDGRSITGEQRKKVFACIKDISLYTGYEAEYARQLLTLAYCYQYNIEPFSLSDCSMETAREFVTYLIEFCIEQDIPLSESAIERTDDINKYLYLTIKKSICSVCGGQGVVYTVTNGNKLSLCNNHYDEAKIKGLERFEKMYKVYSIKIKEE